MENIISTKYEFKNSVTNLTKLQKYEEQLKRLKVVMANMPEQVSYTNMSGSVKETTSKMKEYKDATKESTKQTKSLGNTLLKGAGFLAFTKILDKVITTLSKFTSKSADMVENLNLMNVAFHRTEDGMNDFQLAGVKFVNTLSDMYGIDESGLTRTVGNFKQLANAMGIADETGTKLAKTLTQLAIDTSSLYNLSFERASEVLQSALAGQTKPVRGAFGADITESTLKIKLDEIGVDSAVRDLSYVEKRLLIVTSLLDQLKESQNDFGRTIESVSNQMKIFNEQTQRLSRAIGNMFLPILQQVLPYINAFLMVLTEIVNWLAILFGYDEDTMAGFSSGIGDITDDFDDLSGAIGNATDSAKKLKQGLRGFDKLNVITTPTSGASGSGGGVGTINPKILDAFNKATKDYEDTLEKVQMKATRIRDAIMEWLGFTKEIDPLTGKVSFKYGGIQKTLKNMWDSFKNLSSTGKVLVGLGLASMFLKTFNNAKKLLGLFGKGNGMLGIVGKLINPTKTLFSYMLTGLKSSHSSLKGSIQSWREQQGIIDKTTGKVNGLKGVMNGVKTALGGLAIGITSFAILNDSLKSATENGWNLVNVLGTIGGNLGMITSGATIGSVFGPLGGAVGAIAGASAGLLETYINMPNAITRTTASISKLNDEIQNNVNKYDAQNKQIDENLTMTLTSIQYYENMVDKLKSIVDEKGEIQKGHEKEADYIVNELNKAYDLNIEIQDGVIQKYKEQIENIDEVIKKKKAEAILEANKEKYVKALENEVQVYYDMIDASDNYTNAKINTQKAQDAVNEAIKEEAKLTKEALAGNQLAQYALIGYGAKLIKKKKALEEAEEAERKAKITNDEATRVYQENSKILMNFSNLQTSVLTGNIETINKSIEEYTNSYVRDNQTIIESEEDKTKRLNDKWKKQLEIYKQNNAEMYDNFKNFLIQETKTIESLTPEQVAKWKALADSDKEAFLSSFQQLGPELQQKVIGKMYNYGYKISDEVQKGIKAINPTIHFDADTTKVKSKLKEILEEKILSAIGISSTMAKIFKIQGFAGGGMPPVGNLFYMNEKEPELLGTIGGKSFVANQSQMMDLIDKKIGNAQNNINSKQPINPTIIVKVGDEELTRKILNNLQDMAEANGKPIEIGG